MISFVWTVIVPGHSPIILSVSGMMQIVGVALVCVSKRYPVWLCLILPLFGCCGLVLSLFLPERLPPTDPPPDQRD